jgi:4'-phosphopantetheinyl transferase
VDARGVTVARASGTVPCRLAHEMDDARLAGTLSVTFVELPSIAQPADVALLSAEETTRADRFAFERDRSSFVTTRAALRRLLAREVGIPPADLELEADAFGRPRLVESIRVAQSTLDFNVSHSGRLGAVVLSRSGRVGIDVEWHERMHSLREVEPEVMGMREREMLQQLEGAEYARAFLGCWTRKEAIVKAIGVGVQYPLRTIDIPSLPDDGCAEFQSNDGRVWSVATLHVNANYTVSLAMAGQVGGSVNATLRQAAMQR